MSEKIAFLAPLILLAAAAFVVPEEEMVRIEPEERYLTFGELSEPLTAEELIVLSLAASGTEEDRGARLYEEMVGMLEEGKQALDGITDPYALGEELLRYLHETVLTRYDENQSSMEELMENGRYNCVSSAILYLIFSRYLGLEAAGVATIDHTFCLVETGEGDIDVETTTIYGFEPGKKKEFTSAFGETGFSYVPPGNYRSRWRVGDRKMISYILQNRISLQERKKQYDLAVELAVDRYFLVKDDETRKDMRKEFVNYAALLNEKGSYLEGLIFISSVRNTHGDSKDYTRIRSVLVNNEVVELIRQNKYEKALIFIDGAANEGIVDEVTLTKHRTMITEKKMIEIIQNSTFETALTEVENSLHNGSVDRRQYRDYIAYLYGKQGEELAKRGKWLEGIALIEEGIDKIGGDSRLLEAKKVFQNNFAAEKHNEFAFLFNTGEHKKALTLLEEALSHMPESEILRRDYRQIRNLITN